MKVKLQEVKKRCPNGEVYIFRNGIAKVPGLYIRKEPVVISIQEFNQMCKEL